MPTQKAIAEHLSLSQQAVSQHMAAMGIKWKASSLDEIRIAYIRKLRVAGAGHLSNDGISDLTYERVQTEQVDRELKQFVLAETKGRLVNLAQLEIEMTQMVAAFRTVLLTMASRIKTEIDAIHGVDLDAQILTEHIQEALAQLSRYDKGSAIGCDPLPLASA
jgi:hypothetical protein